MGRQIVENLPRRKVLRNQYRSGDQTHTGNVNIYTVPTGKVAKINFNNCTMPRGLNGYITYAVFQLGIIKDNSSQKFWGNIAVGYMRHSSNESSQIVTFRPWYMYQDIHRVATGNYNAARSGLSTGRSMKGVYSGNNNTAYSSVSNDIANNPYELGQNSPWSSSYNDGAVMCDAHKDYIAPEGSLLYFQYYCQHSSGIQGTGNQVDITVDVEEMEQYA